jgi:hypothetical protein
MFRAKMVGSLPPEKFVHMEWGLVDIERNVQTVQYSTVQYCTAKECK